MLSHQKGLPITQSKIPPPQILITLTLFSSKHLAITKITFLIYFILPLYYLLPPPPQCQWGHCQLIHTLSPVPGTLQFNKYVPSEQ